MGQTNPEDFGNGGTIDGDLIVSGDLQVSGGGSLSFDEIVEGTSQVKVTNTSAFLVEKSDGTDVFVVDTTNSRVGVGVAPSHELTVNNQIGIKRDGTDAFGTLTFDSAGLKINQSTSGYSPLIILSNSSEIARFSADGDLGIGTTSTANKPISVKVNRNGTQELKFENDDSGEWYFTLQNDRITEDSVSHAINFDANDSGGTNTRYSKIENVIVDNTSGSEDGRLVFSTFVNGTSTETMHITNSSVGIGGMPSDDLHIINSENVYLQLESSNTGTTKESAIKYSNFSTGSNFWWVGLNQSDDYSLAYGTSFSGANTRLLLTETGLLGIGTASPDNPLSIRTDTADKGIVLFADGESSSNRIFNVMKDSSAGRLFLRDAGTPKIHFNAKSNEDHYINNGGSLGIGTDSPTALLSVQQASGSDTDFTNSNNPEAHHGILLNNNRFEAGSFTAITMNTANASSVNGVSIISQSASSGHAGKMIFARRALSGTTESMRIDENGNVGIGTENPAQGQSTPISDIKLDVAGNQMLSNLSSTNSDESKLFFFRSDGAVGSQGAVPDGLKIGAIEWTALTSGDNNNSITSARIEAEAGSTWSSASNRNADITFSTVGANTLAERMRINSTGVGIGTASPATNAKLHVVDGAGTAPTMHAGDMVVFQNNNDTSDNAGIVVVSGTGSGTSNGLSYLTFGDSAVKNQGGMIYYNGNDSLEIRTNATSAINIDSNQSVQFAQNVGIGMAPASSVTLDINISTDARGSFMDGISEIGSDFFGLNVTNSAGNILKPMGIRAEDIRLVTGSAERMRVTDSGVGIGTSAARQLHVHGADGGQVDGLHITNTDTGATSSDGFTIGLDANENAFFFGRESGKKIEFYPSGTKRFSIDDNSRISLSNNDSGGTGGTDSTSGNTIFGYLAGSSIQDTSIDNTYIGHKSGASTTTADNNVAIGARALFSTTVAGNSVAVGELSGYSVTDHGNNVFVGQTAGFHQTGESNVFIGKDAGLGSSGDSGDDNVVIGKSASLSGASSANQTVIGKGATGQADNSVTLGNSSVTKLYIAPGNTSGQTITFKDDSAESGFIQYDHSDDQMKLASNNAIAMRIFDSVILIGRSSAGSTGNGHSIRTADSAIFSRDSAGETMQICRNASDGQFIQFRSNGTIVGDIKNTGGTVSLTGFSGCHESSSSDTLEVGTVVSTIDEEHSENHAKVEISNSVGDKRVYGVVSDLEGLNGNNVTVASVGISSIKVTGSCKGGDLLESNGDGTAKVQSDDIIRSKTIGKVTMGNSDEEVKLVSCVLYCG